jgi:hypothetical protein
VKCPRCGSGNTRSLNVLGGWLRRHFCNECQHTWTEEVGPRLDDRGKRGKLIHGLRALAGLLQAAAYHPAVRAAVDEAVHERTQREEDKQVMSEKQVTKDAPRVRVPLIGWMAARQLAKYVGQQALLVEGVESKALDVFIQADEIVREEASDR